MDYNIEPYTQIYHLPNLVKDENLAYREINLSVHVFVYAICALWVSIFTTLQKILYIYSSHFHLSYSTSSTMFTRERKLCQLS